MRPKQSYPSAIATIAALLGGAFGGSVSVTPTIAAPVSRHHTPPTGGGVAKAKRAAKKRRNRNKRLSNRR